MVTKPKRGDHERERRIIDASYGLVLGAYDGLHGSDERGYQEWRKPDVQKAAMQAARDFLDATESTKQ